MKAPRLSCPHACYTAEMKIQCGKTGGNGFCGFQYYKRCKGWWSLTEAAGRCKLRRIPEDEEGGPNYGP